MEPTKKEQCCCCKCAPECKCDDCKCCKCPDKSKCGKKGEECKCPCAKECKDKKDWESSAAAACKAKGKILTRVDYHNSCGCDSYRDVEFTCCTTMTPPPPPPPPPPPTCFDMADGAAGICRSEADWKAVAEMTCAGKGYKLRDIAFGTPCRPTGGGMVPGYAEVKYKCCK